MSDVKWTEGEWRVVERVTNGVNGFEICWSDDGEAITDHVYEEADAHVMAASKQLYGILEAVLKEIDRCDIVFGEDELRKKIHIAEDVMAKARGEQQ